MRNSKSLERISRKVAEFDLMSQLPSQEVLKRNESEMEKKCLLYTRQIATLKADTKPQNLSKVEK